MNVTQGNLFWNEDVGIIKNYPYLSQKIKCDVLVIGAGIGGALSAYMQAKQGANVVVVDKNIIGYGATIETNGVLESRIDVANNTSKNLSKKDLDKCNELCKRALEDIEDIINEIATDEECKKYIGNINFKRKDLICYSDKVTNKIGMYKTFERLGKENREIEYLEEDPLLNLKTAIIFPSSAASINPYVFTQLIFMYLSKKHNVRIYENTNIANISSRDDGVESITSNRFKIYSKNVILTNGIHINEYLDKDDITVNKVFNIVSEKIEGIDSSVTNIVAKDSSVPNTSICFLDDRVIVTGESIRQNEKMLNEKYFKQYADGRYKRLYLYAEKMCNVENIKVTNCFYGIYLDTKDGLPIIDELEELPNVYCNLGVGKNGIIYSMVGANMLKDISKQYHVKDMYLFRESRN